MISREGGKEREEGREGGRGEGGKEREKGSEGGSEAKREL